MVRTIHEQCSFVLANCEAFSGNAVSFDGAKIRFAKIVLLLPTLSLIPVDAVIRSFFASDPAEQIKQAYQINAS
ncbi:unnamed protein product [Anisakis simplex]|nr:unnamed protein product [Anisakis simplex]